MSVQQRHLQEHGGLGGPLLSVDRPLEDAVGFCSGNFEGVSIRAVGRTRGFLGNDTSLEATGG